MLNNFCDSRGLLFVLKYQRVTSAGEDLQVQDLDLILGSEDPVLPLKSKREDRFSSSILGLLCELNHSRNQIIEKLLSLKPARIFSVVEIASQYPGKQ